MKCSDCTSLVEQDDDSYGEALPWTWKCDKGKGYRHGTEDACDEISVDKHSLRSQKEEK